MIVVLDTTETFADLRLSGPNFMLLKAYFVGTTSTLVVPQIVVDEMVNHFRERLARHVRSAGDNLREIGVLIGSPRNVPELRIDESEAVAQYRAHLEQQVKLLGGRVVGFEKVTLGSIIDRSLRRRKPFDGEGRKGFRDAVLWETILREVIVDSSGEIALITKNSTDFGKDGLAVDLREDVAQVSEQKECVKLFEGLQAFIDLEVKPHLKKLDSIHKQIQEGVYKSFDPVAFYRDCHDIIRDEVRPLVQRYDLERLTHGVTGYFHSHDLHSLGSDVHDISVVDVWSIDENQIAVGIDYSTDGEIACLEQQEEYYGDGDEFHAELVDREFVGDVDLTLSMTVILNRESGEWDNFEINELEMVLGTRWPQERYY